MIGVPVIGSVDAVIDPDHIVAAVVLVVTHEDVQIVIQCEVIDVAESSGKHVQVAAVEPAPQDPPLLKQQPIPFGSLHIGAVVTHRQVQPPVETDNHTVGTMQPGIVLFRLQAQAPQQVTPGIGHTVAIGVSQRRQQRRVHHVDRSVGKRQALDRIEALGIDSRRVGVAVTIGVGDQPHLVTSDDLHAQAGDVVVSHQQCAGARSDREDRGVLDQGIAGEQGRDEPVGNHQSWKPLFGFRADLGSPRGSRFCGETASW